METLDLKTERLQLERDELRRKLLEIIGPRSDKLAETLIYSYGSISQRLGAAWLVGRIMSSEEIAPH